MATNLKIDPKLIDRAKRLGKMKTKRETVEEALEEFIQRREVDGLIAMFGKVNFDAAFDHKAGRMRKIGRGATKRGAAA